MLPPRLPLSLRPTLRPPLRDLLRPTLRPWTSRLRCLSDGDGTRANRPPARPHDAAPDASPRPRSDAGGPQQRPPGPPSGPPSRESPTASLTPHRSNHPSPTQTSGQNQSPTSTSFSPAITCSVCRESFATNTRLTRHIFNQQDVSCWPAVFTSRGQALKQQEEHKLRNAFIEVIGSRGWGERYVKDAEGRQLYRERVCQTCKTTFPSKQSRTEHLVTNDSCWIDDPRKENLFACWACYKAFTTFTAVRAHIQSSPGCASQIRVRTLKPKLPRTSAMMPKDPKALLTLARSRYSFSAGPVLLAHQILDAMPPPANMHSQKEQFSKHLRSIHDHAISANDRRLLRYFAQYYESVQRIHQGAVPVSASAMRKSSAESSDSKTQPTDVPVQKIAPSQKSQASIREEDNLFTSLVKSNAGLELQLKELKEQMKSLQEQLKIQGRTNHDPSQSLSSATSSKQISSQERKPRRDMKANSIRSESGGRGEKPSTGFFDTAIGQTEPVQDSSSRLTKPKANTAKSNVPSAQHTVNALPAPNAAAQLNPGSESCDDSQNLSHQIHTQSKSMKSSDDLMSLSTNPLTSTSPIPNNDGTLDTEEMSTQTLLDELFPGASDYTQPHHTKRNPYPKLNLPESAPLIWKYHPKETMTLRERFTDAFKNKTDQITALQLVHCSTELTESDFRRLVPKGKHIESWARDGEFYKVIPGRDPISLERLPFYYLLFRSPEAALRYQSNASRLHKLSQLHQPQNALSAIMPPKGFLENGEDINFVTSSYLLIPQNQDLGLNMLMKPYHPALDALIKEGGYRPIVPSTNPSGKEVHKVLFHIEGYEPSAYDLYQLFVQDAVERGLAWPFLHDHHSIHRLRDIADLKAQFKPLASINPGSPSPRSPPLSGKYDEPGMNVPGSEDDPDMPRNLNQIIMNRVYNRWIVEFSDEDGARRFARLWNRKKLPMQSSQRHQTWRDLEEVRMCNAEYLW